MPRDRYVHDDLHKRAYRVIIPALQRTYGPIMDKAVDVIAALEDAGIELRLREAENTPQWCPVCHAYHVDPGEKTDAGGLIRQCPRMPENDPRNVFENYPLSTRERLILEASGKWPPR